MPRRSLRLFALALSASLVGCGPAPTQNDPDEPDGYVDAFHGALVEVACRAVVECPESRTNVFPWYGKFTDRASCERFFLVEYPELLPFVGVEEAIAQGRILVDADAERDCVAALRASAASLPACASSQVLDASACDGVLTGTVAPGGACHVSEACAGDARCDRSPCPGAIRTQPPGYEEGCYAECGADGACGAGEECRQFNGGAISICLRTDGTSPPDPSDRCGGVCVANLDRCAADPCVDGESCRQDRQTGEFACRPKLGEGDACTFGDDCTRDSSRVGCVEESGVCTRYGTVPVGGFCDEFDAYCEPHLRCTGPGETCAPLPDPPSLTEGEDCSNAFWNCAVGLACVADPTQEPRVATCEPLKAAGQPCYFSQECAGGQVCLGAVVGSSASAPGECGDLLSGGAACSANHECVSEQCRAGVCEARELCELP